MSNSPLRDEQLSVKFSSLAVVDQKHLDQTFSNDSSESFEAVGNYADQIEWCIKNGDVKDLEDFLQNGNWKFCDVNSSLSRPAMVIAADFGQNDMIRFLCALGASLNDSDRYGVTPLLAAIWEGHEHTVRLLLECGADASVTFPSGQSYLEQATGNEAVLKIIQQWINKH